MGTVDLHDPKIVSEALVVWHSKGESPYPKHDEQRLVTRYGKLAAADLLPIVQRLEEEFDESDAAETVADPIEMTNVAAARFRDLHPELSDEGVEALAWCYSYNNR